jgi:hypothetical protein
MRGRAGRSVEARILGDARGAREARAGNARVRAAPLGGRAAS